MSEQCPQLCRTELVAKFRVILETAKVKGKKVCADVFQEDHPCLDLPRGPLLGHFPKIESPWDLASNLFRSNISTPVLISWLSNGFSTLLQQLLFKTWTLLPLLSKTHEGLPLPT